MKLIVHEIHTDQDRVFEGTEDIIKDQLLLKYPFLQQMPNKGFWPLIQYLGRQQFCDVFVDGEAQQIDEMLQAMSQQADAIHRAGEPQKEHPIPHGADPLPPGLRDMWHYEEE